MMSRILQVFLENVWIRLGVFFALVIGLQLVLAQSKVLRSNSSNKNDNNESKRRIQHALTGTVLVQISYVLPLPLCLTALTLGCVAIYYARNYTSAAWYDQTFGPLLRPHERSPGVLPGAFWFLVGTTVTAACFDLVTARFAVLTLSWADPMAAWVGQAVPSPPILSSSSSSSATVAGSTAAFLTTLALARCGLFAFSWSTACIASMACTVSEAMPTSMGVMNDNWMIPIVTATAVASMQHYYEQ